MGTIFANFVAKVTRNVRQTGRKSHPVAEGIPMSVSQRREIGRDAISDYRETIDILAAHDRDEAPLEPSSR